MIRIPKECSTCKFDWVCSLQKKISFAKILLKNQSERYKHGYYKLDKEDEEECIYKEENIRKRE